MFWRCRTASHSEDYPDDQSTPTIQTFGDATRGDPPPHKFNVYQSLVKAFSPRALTFPSDALSAFAGVLTALSEKLDWAFTSALPDAMFDLALLWWPMGSVTLRPSWTNKQKATASRITSATTSVIKSGSTTLKATTEAYSTTLAP